MGNALRWCTKLSPVLVITTRAQATAAPDRTGLPRRRDGWVGTSVSPIPPAGPSCSNRLATMINHGLLLTCELANRQPSAGWGFLQIRGKMVAVPNATDPGSRTTSEAF